VADVDEFELCGGVDYTKQYNACGFAIFGQDLEFPDISMIDFYQEIAPKLKKTWIFSGDTDAMVPMQGTRAAVQAIGFPIVKNQSYRAWYYNETAASLDFLAKKNPKFGGNLVASQLGEFKFLFPFLCSFCFHCFLSICTNIFYLSLTPFPVFHAVFVV